MGEVCGVAMHWAIEKSGLLIWIMGRSDRVLLRESVAEAICESTILPLMKFGSRSEEFPAENDENDVIQNASSPYSFSIPCCFNISRSRSSAACGSGNLPSLISRANA